MIFDYENKKKQEQTITRFIINNFFIKNKIPVLNNVEDNQFQY